MRCILQTTTWTGRDNMRADSLCKKEKKTYFLAPRFIINDYCTNRGMLTLYGSLRLYAQITGAPSLSVPKASVFLDKDGKQIGDRFSAERRYWVGLDEISPFLIDAVIATEDQKLL